jgi:isoquinoline 1-oxidoreductase beta subunit
VKNYDDSAALLVPGVKKVFKVVMKVFNTNREGVAVVADSTWAAIEGKRA